MYVIANSTVALFGAVLLANSANSVYSDNTIKENTSILVEINENIDSDKKCLDFFNDLNNKINQNISKIDFNTYKNNFISAFIVITDFIFYNGEISGYTFSSLSNEAKREVLSIYQNIDNTINAKYPGYKEEIKSITKKNYKIVKNMIKSLIDKLDSTIENTVDNKTSDGTYSTFKQDVKDTIEEVYDDVKGKVNDVYENVKNSEVVDNVKDKYENVKDDVSNWYQNLKEKYN